MGIAMLVSRNGNMVGLVQRRHGVVNIANADVRTTLSRIHMIALKAGTIGRRGGLSPREHGAANISTCRARLYTRAMSRMLAVHLRGGTCLYGACASQSPQKLSGPKIEYGFSL